QCAAVEGHRYPGSESDAEYAILATPRSFPHLAEECGIHVIFNMDRQTEPFAKMRFERCSFIARNRRSCIDDFALFPVDDSCRTDADASDIFTSVQFLPDDGFNFVEYAVVLITARFYLFPYRESLILIHHCTLDECPPDIHSQITHRFHLVFPDVAEVPRQYLFGTVRILINDFFYDFPMLFEHLLYLFAAQIDGWCNLEEIVRNDAGHLYE